jgi:hypothetical protein
MAPPFLTPALNGGEWSDSRPGQFTPLEIAPHTHCLGGCVGPRVGLDAVEQNKIWPYRESKPGRQTLSPPL